VGSSSKKDRQVIYKTDEEIELIRESCLLVCKTLTHVATRLRAGITGLEIDKEAEELIRDHNAVPSFKGYGGFPAALCVSINDQVVHGIPTIREFKDGDIVSVDCGVYLNGFHGDAAYTFAIGNVKPDTLDLLRATKTSLYKAIEQVAEGKRLGDIGFAIQEYLERKHRYGVVRDLVGHGIGRDLHEAPEVPHHGKRGQGPVLKSGLVIAIEPMVNLGKKEVKVLGDQWTVVSVDRKPSAHYEHTVAVRKKGADILSNHSFIEEAIKNNSELLEILIKN
jgi:methionyl aminopeptidase